MSVKEQSTDDVKMWWEQKSGLQRTLESVSDALTTAEIDPQQYEIYFFQDNKAKKKKLMVRSPIGIPKQCLSLLTVKSPKDIILLTHMYFFL